jgi:hypothetical protein
LKLTSEERVGRERGEEKGARSEERGGQGKEMVEKKWIENHEAVPR